MLTLIEMTGTVKEGRNLRIHELRDTFAAGVRP